MTRRLVIESPAVQTLRQGLKSMAVEGDALIFSAAEPLSPHLSIFSISPPTRFSLFLTSGAGGEKNVILLRWERSKQTAQMARWGNWILSGDVDICHKLLEMINWRRQRSEWCDVRMFLIQAKIAPRLRSRRIIRYLNRETSFIGTHAPADCA